jgi:hypothetical protein
MVSQLLGMMKSEIILHIAGKVKGICYAAFLIRLPQSNGQIKR